MRASERASGGEGRGISPVKCARLNDVIILPFICRVVCARIIPITLAHTHTTISPYSGVGVGREEGGNELRRLHTVDHQSFAHSIVDKQRMLMRYA